MGWTPECQRRRWNEFTEAAWRAWAASLPPNGFGRMNRIGWEDWIERMASGQGPQEQAPPNQGQPAQGQPAQGIPKAQAKTRQQERFNVFGDTTGQGEGASSSSGRAKTPPPLPIEDDKAKKKPKSTGKKKVPKN